MSDVAAHIAAISSPTRRRDAEVLVELMRRATGEEPVLSGTIIGFGRYHYRYASGREGDAAAAAFAPRKTASTVYLMDGVDAHADDLARLGEHTTGVGCLYLKNLAAVDLVVLEKIVRDCYRTLTSGVFGSNVARP